MMETDKYLNSGRTVMNYKYEVLCIDIGIVKYCEKDTVYM